MLQNISTEEGAQERLIYFVSDGTGITAETLGQSILTQFEGIMFEKATLPFINSVEKAQQTVEFINHCTQQKGKRAIIFSTTVSDEIRTILSGVNGLFMDLFDSFVHSVEDELRTKSTHTEGKAHGATASDRYQKRIEAMNFALALDDGINTVDLDKADVIVIAPSRCGKTPTCIYMAMQYGVFAANYPLTEDDLETDRLPKVLAPYKDKLYGLTSDPHQLHQIRTERRPGSNYASLKQCVFELQQAESMYRRSHLSFVNSANISIEEIATLLMQERGIKRTAY